jgi:superfamily II RNA helicase
MTADAAALVAAFEATLPFPLDAFQREAMLALAHHHSVLVAAPTGTGKTVIAEFAVHLARQRGLRVLYTTPIKALSNQKYRDFRARYGEASVGLLTGDLVLQPDAAIQVMTTEVLRNRLVQGTDTLDDVGAARPGRSRSCCARSAARPGRSRSCCARATCRWYACRPRCPTRRRSRPGCATCTAT